MTVYNFLYYYDNTIPPGDTAAALTDMFFAMNPSTQGAIGGVAFIPQQNFNAVSASSSGFVVPDQCNIFSSGTGGSGPAPPYYHFVIEGTGGLTFLSCSGTPYTTGGTYLQSLAFRWEGSSDVGDTCILAATPNCCAIRCTFTDCPLAFKAQAPGCALKQCTIAYESPKDPNGATAVVIASSQCAVLGPGEFLQSQISEGGPPDCTCISVQGGADHTVIADMHIANWTTGVDFSQADGSTNTQIRNCEIQCYFTALNIEVGSNAPVTGVKVMSTLLTRGNDSPEENTLPVVLIDPGAYGNAQISDVTLIGCTVYSMGPALAGQHGLEIIGGTNIKIIGGTFSNNSPSLGAGIAITGACGDVQIIGANLQPSYNNGTTGSIVQSQQFGFLVTSNPAGTVLVSDCDMRGYTTTGSAPVSTSGVTSGLYIYDCLGYNDQSTPLDGPTAPTSPTNAATCSTPYFGASIITFTNASPVTLNVFGQHLSLSFGVVFLPSPYDSFWFSSPTPPSGFSWYGK